MEWHHVVFTNAQIEEEGILNKLKDQFLAVYMKVADPSDMAILSDDDYKNGRIAIYFSPVCSPDCDTMIRFYGGALCDAPPREHIFVLAGDDDILDALN